MKPKPKMVDCVGEAHSNPFIDNCWVCMPFWARYPTCSKCGKKLRTKHGFCNKCRIYHDMSEVDK
jgi:hypothetical protein